MRLAQQLSCRSPLGAQVANRSLWARNVNLLLTIPDTSAGQLLAGDS